MQHLAWLHAVPDSKREGEVSRQSALEHYNVTVEFPDCDASYILDYLFEIGLTLGESPLTHSEIESYQRNTGIELQPFEVRFIKRLSETYLSASQKMKSVNAETPWEDCPPQMSAKYINSQRSRESIRNLVKA